MKLDNLKIILQVLNSPNVSIPFGQAAIAVAVLEDLQRDIDCAVKIAAMEAQAKLHATGTAPD